MWNFEIRAKLNDNVFMKNDSKMCKLTPEEWDDNKKEIRDRVRGATLICTKCFRVSNDEKKLCKPKNIK